VKNYLTILKPKSKEDIIRGLNNLTQKEKDIKLIDACIESKQDLVKLLIELGADVNAKNDVGDTPLIWASYNGDKELVKLLIKVGANINAKNKYEKNALYYARINNHKDLVKLFRIN